MKECFKCGIGEDKAFLYTGISKEGIVNVCRKCLQEVDIPLLEKKEIPKDFDAGKRESVRTRLSRMAGLKDDKFDRERELRKLVEKKKDTTLDDLVEKNFKKNLPKTPEKDEELVENFHWIIMRRRRALKMTQLELAEKIFEPAIAIESAEKGILPKDHLALIKKLEKFLDVDLFKAPKKEVHPDLIVEESKVATGVTIGDLKKMHDRNFLGFKRKHKEEKKEEKQDSEEDKNIDVEELNLERVEEVVGKPIDNKREEVKEKRSSRETKADGISQEELDRIIFG